MRKHILKLIQSTNDTFDRLPIVRINCGFDGLLLVTTRIPSAVVGSASKVDENLSATGLLYTLMILDLTGRLKVGRNSSLLLVSVSGVSCRISWRSLFLRIPGRVVRGCVSTGI